MLGPPSEKPHIFTRCDLPEVAYGGVGGRELRVLIRGQADHDKSPVITTEKHVLDHTFEDLL
jgi:hypothetical protein